MSAERLRVALLAEFLEIGGQERVIETISRGLAPPFEPVVIGTAGGGAVADALARDGFRVIVPGLDRIYARSDADRLAAILAGERIRVVHTHAYPAGVLGRRAAARAGIAARIAHYHSVYTMWRLRHRLVERRLARRTHAIACISDAVAAFARDRVGIPEGRIRVIRNGVSETYADGMLSRGDARRRLGERFRLVPEEFVAVCVAGLNPQKGHRVLLGALRLLDSQSRGRHKIKLLVAGSGPEEPALRAMHPGHAPHGSEARYLGLLEDPRLVYAAADVFVLPSVEREGLGLAILEAMACGLPVVASRVGGIPEAVEDGVTGILVPPGDPAALAAALGRLRLDRDLGRRMGEAGRDRARRLFSASAMVRSLEALYREALEGV